MNYEQRYKKALERAREYKKHGYMMINAALDNIFPELKESEDERIRKALIELVKFSKKSCFELLKDQSFNIVSMDTMLTWLKKQGNSSIKWNKNTKDCKPKVKHSVLMETTHGIAEGEWQGEKWYQYRWACLIKDTEVLSWMELSNLETQVGPPKEFTITYENEVGNGNTKGLVTSKVLLPKFKVGDWICGYACFAHISSIEDGMYYFDDGSALSTEFVDKYYNLWTIEDAEDGDVLAFKDGTSGMLLYKENTETFGVLSHCRIIRNNFIDKEESGWGSTLLSPATKEQRDDFFAKMREAGYEWDAENKVLKKISISMNKEDLIKKVDEIDHILFGLNANEALIVLAATITLVIETMVSSDKHSEVTKTLETMFNEIKKQN